MPAILAVNSSARNVGDSPPQPPLTSRQRSLPLFRTEKIIDSSPVSITYCCSGSQGIHIQRQEHYENPSFVSHPRFEASQT